MKRSRRTILIIAALALIIICAAGIYLMSQVPNMLIRAKERSIAVTLGLWFYCGENTETFAETSSPDCNTWADEFRVEHSAMIRKCDDLLDPADMDLDQFMAFNDCLDEAGGHPYLPTE